MLTNNFILSPEIVEKIIGPYDPEKIQSIDPEYELFEFLHGNRVDDAFERFIEVSKDHYPPETINKWIKAHERSQQNKRVLSLTDNDGNLILSEDE